MWLLACGTPGPTPTPAGLVGDGPRAAAPEAVRVPIVRAPHGVEANVLCQPGEKGPATLALDLVSNPRGATVSWHAAPPRDGAVPVRVEINWQGPRSLMGHTTRGSVDGRCRFVER